MLVVKSLQERAQTLEEMADRAVFYYNAPQNYDEAALAKFEQEHLRVVFETVAEKLSVTNVVDTAGFDALFKDLCTEKGWKMPQVGQPVRIALSGGTQAPGVGEIIQVLGSEEAIRRIRSAGTFLVAK
jgi:glutamyl-tRNA synthetase